MKKAYPVRLTIKSKVTLPDALVSYGYLNQIRDKFDPFPNDKRTFRKRKVVYTGFITTDSLERVLDIIDQYEGVTATVVCL